MNNIKFLLLFLCVSSIKAVYAQPTSITIDSIVLKLTVTTQEDKKLKTKIIFENLGNHKIKSCFTNQEGNADFVLPSEAKYKITIPASDDSYEYEIPEFTISPLPVTFKFGLRPASNALVGINVLNNPAIKNIPVSSTNEPAKLFTVINDTSYLELGANEKYSINIKGVEIKNNSINTVAADESLNYILYFYDNTHAELLRLKKTETAINIIYTNLFDKPVSNEPITVKGDKGPAQYKIKTANNGSALAIVPLGDHYNMSLTFFPNVFELKTGSDTNSLLITTIKLKFPSTKEYEITKKEAAARIAKRDSLYRLYETKKELSIAALKATLDSAAKATAKKITIPGKEKVTIAPATAESTDDVVMHVLNRNKDKWKTKVIVTDVTGSMYPYMKEVALWQKLEQMNHEASDYVFFNDGDNKPDYQKEIGNTGGIYFSLKNNPDSMLTTMYLAMAKGSGGDPAENDLEALLRARKYKTDSAELILIADNYAPVKDLELLNQLTVPVRVILCGAKFTQVNPDYLRIAYKTGGSVHTIEEDIMDLSKLHDGESIKIGNAEYRIQAGYFFLVKRL